MQREQFVMWLIQRLAMDDDLAPCPESVERQFDAGMEWWDKEHPAPAGKATDDLVKLAREVGRVFQVIQEPTIASPNPTQNQASRPPHANPATPETEKVSTEGPAAGKAGFPPTGDDIWERWYFDLAGAVLGSDPTLSCVPEIREAAAMHRLIWEATVKRQQEPPKP
jgi:hypothetical protein